MNDQAYNNVFIEYYDDDFYLREWKYIEVTGIYVGITKHRSGMGVVRELPTVKAKTIKELTYIEVISLTIKTIKPRDTITQHGYSIILEKIEFAEEETRIYLYVVNNGKDRFNIYSSNSVILQDNRQYEEQKNNETYFSKISYDIRPGVEEEGVITFPKIEQRSFKLEIDARSNSNDEKFEEFVFDVYI